MTLTLGLCDLPFDMTLPPVLGPLLDMTLPPALGRPAFDTTLVLGLSDLPLPTMPTPGLIGLRVPRELGLLRPPTSGGGGSQLNHVIVTSFGDSPRIVFVQGSTHGVFGPDCGREEAGMAIGQQARATKALCGDRWQRAKSSWST
mmetsp:Transcript_115973/g.201347  ORF Transcript_115973/g.201347 Transcript_115973/m.201347 type:complete len:145 (+) Transcript_115973:212-646(+)